LCTLNLRKHSPKKKEGLVLKKKKVTYAAMPEGKARHALHRPETRVGHHRVRDEEKKKKEKKMKLEERKGKRRADFLKEVSPSGSTKRDLRSLYLGRGKKKKTERVHRGGKGKMFTCLKNTDLHLRGK